MSHVHNQAYLLRLLWSDNGGDPVWRYVLEAIDGSASHHFRTLEALNDFLVRQTLPRGVPCSRQAYPSPRWQSRSSHDESIS